MLIVDVEHDVVEEVAVPCGDVGVEVEGDDCDEVGGVGLLLGLLGGFMLLALLAVRLLLLHIHPLLLPPPLPLHPIPLHSLLNPQVNKHLKILRLLMLLKVLLRIL